MPNIGPFEVLLLLSLVAWIPALVIAGMKGRWVWFVLGLLFWLPAFVGAALPPRRNSSWALRRQSP
jgi:hypothetical protein